MAPCCVAQGCGHAPPVGGAASTGHRRGAAELVTLACELTAWMQTLAPHGLPARRWEPERLRTRLFTVPARLARNGRRVPRRVRRRLSFVGRIKSWRAPQTART